MCVCAYLTGLVEVVLPKRPCIVFFDCARTHAKTLTPPTAQLVQNFVQLLVQNFVQLLVDFTTPTKLLQQIRHIHAHEISDLFVGNLLRHFALHHSHTYTHTHV